LQDDLDQIRGHLARQGEHFIGVLFQDFRNQHDFLFAWRWEVPQLHFGEEIRRETDAPGQFPEGVAFLQAELPDQGAEGFFHNGTYNVETPSLSMKKVTLYENQPALSESSLFRAFHFVLLITDAAIKN
jgi:hypothetical protein